MLDNPRFKSKSPLWKRIKMKHAFACCCSLLCCFVCLLVLIPIIFSRPKMNQIMPSTPMDGTSVGSQCWIPEGREFCAPQFIIAGAMKCGTTSMFSYLLQHPDVLPLRSYELDRRYAKPVVAEKEVRFFIDPNWSILVEHFGQEGAVNLYLDLFEEIPPPGKQGLPYDIQENMYKITGEGSPMYICQPGVAQRIIDVLPQIKVIIMLRHPVDRSWSEFNFLNSLLPEKITEETFTKIGTTREKVFDDCISIDMRVTEFCMERIQTEDPYGAQLFYCVQEVYSKTYNLRATDPKCSGEFRGMCIPKNIKRFCRPFNALNSLYGVQLREWHDLIPQKQSMYILSEEFFENPVSVMQETAQFLGLNSFDWTKATNTSFNIARPTSKNAKGLEVSSSVKDYDTLSKSVHDKLYSWFKLYNYKLQSLSFGPSMIQEWNKMNK